MSKAARVSPPKESASIDSAARVGRRRLLVGLLLFTVLLYAGTLPWQRRMAEETERINKENAANQEILARQNEADKSLRAARDEVERNPSDVNAQIRLAQRYAEAGRLDEAETRAQIAVGLQPKALEPLLVLADVEQRARHYDAAIRAYKSALALSPADARSRIGLAYLWISFGWPQDAEALLEPSVAETPQNPYLKVALALAFVQHGDYSAAENLLQEIRRLAPEEATLWSPLVHVYNEMKRYDQAVIVARDSIARLPNDAPIVSEMGKSYYYLNDYSQAETTFRRALAIRPDDLTAHYYLALTYKRIGRLPAAVTELETVLQRNPDFEQTRQILGTLYLSTNRATEGRKLIQQTQTMQAHSQRHQRMGMLVSQKPNDPQAHWQMAAVYWDERNNGRALVEVRKTLELDPNHEAARDMLVKLQAAGTR